MNKQEFLKELENKLYGLPQEDIKKSLEFYGEMIDDRLEDGVLEEDAVSQMGDVQSIAAQILIDTPITKLVKQKIKPARRMNALEIVLLVLGAPIWLSLLVSVIAVIISVYISLWSIVISLWVSEVAFVCSALGGFAAATIIFATAQNASAGAIMVAAGVFLIGFSILFFFLCKASTKGMAWLTKKITLWIKSCFLRKDAAK